MAPCLAGAPPASWVPARTQGAIVVCSSSPGHTATSYYDSIQLHDTCPLRLLCDGGDSLRSSTSGVSDPGRGSGGGGSNGTGMGWGGSGRGEYSYSILQRKVTRGPSSRAKLRKRESRAQEEGTTAP
jgi:hypothetical protein